MDVRSIQSPFVPVSSNQNAERVQTAGSPARYSAEADGVEPADAERAVTQPVDASKPDSTASREDVEAAVATIQDFVQSVQRSINFSLEESTGRVVVKVTDAGSGDVIRQIPSEEALQLAENLSEVRSLLFEAKA